MIGEHHLIFPLALISDNKEVLTDGDFEVQLKNMMTPFFEEKKEVK